MEQVRRGRIRNYPPPLEFELEIMEEANRLYGMCDLLHWPNVTEIFPPTTLFVADSSEYLMGHPAPPKSFYLIKPEQIFFMNIYGQDTTRPCEGSYTRPVYGAATIVIPSVDCSGVSITKWIFDYVSGAFRLLQMHHNEFLKLSKLNLPFPDPEGKWKRDFPFPYDDPEVIGSFRSLAHVVHRIARNTDNDKKAALLPEYWPKREHLAGLLKERSGDYSADDFLKYITWSEGLAHFSAYEIMGGLTPGFTRMSSRITDRPDFIPYKKFHNRNLREDYLRFRHASVEPITMEDIVILGSMTSSIIASLLPSHDWRTYVMSQDIWLEDLMGRARAEYRP